MTAVVFRKQALDGLSEPGRLDERLDVASPSGWAALAVALAILAGCAGWAVFGSYRVTVTGQGLLVPAGGAFVGVYAPKAGWVDSYIQRGDRVKRGDLIARLNAPEDVARLADAEARVSQLQAQRSALRAQLDAHLGKETAAAERKRDALQETIDLAQARVRELAELLRQREGLQGKGLATAERVIEARERLFAARESISRARTDLISVDASLLSLRHQSDQEWAAIERQLRDGEGQRDQIRLGQRLATTIEARVDGVVTMNEVGNHALVGPGQKLMVIEQGGPRLEALLYVPARSGKEIRLGMEVRLSPSVARKEEYGSLLGLVVEVDASPESQSALNDRLGNPDLARLFTRDGPPLQIVVRLEPGSGGPDSYAWTSARGAEIRLTSTTLLEGQVTVKTGRPVALLIPALRRMLGL
ncbi:NHLP bacteriocin system secretion protein [Methylobacterium oryzihabitans]|nr:NHLP bacteriocin system secretion protein [Methylobacterium oryzihabitans]